MLGGRCAREFVVGPALQEFGSVRCEGGDPLRQRLHRGGCTVSCSQGFQFHECAKCHFMSWPWVLAFRMCLFGGLFCRCSLLSSQILFVYLFVGLLFVCFWFACAFVLSFFASSFLVWWQCVWLLASVRVFPRPFLGFLASASCLCIPLHSPLVSPCCLCCL